MAIVQVRGVDDRAVAELKARAARRGQTLSEYLREELEALAAEPTLDDVLARIAQDEPVVGAEPSYRTIRRERETRERRLADRS